MHLMVAESELFYITNLRHDFYKRKGFPIFYLFDAQGHSRELSPR